jgi:hypothetical protein
MQWAIQMEVRVEGFPVQGLTCVAKYCAPSMQ